MVAKHIARCLLIVGMTASVALIILGNLEPLFSTSSPRAEFSSWSNCKTAGGRYACYIKFSSPAANAECSEMDDRTTTVAVLSVIWVLASVQTILVMVWELCGGAASPMAHLHAMLFGWTGGIGIALTVLLSQTLIASLCDSPLTFTDQTGQMELGGILICAAAGSAALSFLVYAVVPADGADSSPSSSSSKTRNRGGSIVRREAPSSGEGGEAGTAGKKKQSKSSS